MSAYDLIEELKGEQAFLQMKKGLETKKKEKANYIICIRFKGSQSLISMFASCKFYCKWKCAKVWVVYEKR